MEAPRDSQRSQRYLKEMLINDRERPKLQQQHKKKEVKPVTLIVSSAP